MAFIPYRPAQPYVLTNVANGQVINATALNGVANSMRHLAERGRLPVTASGMRVNDRVIPVVGVAFPDLPTFKLTRRYVSIPVTIPPHDTHFNMFFTYRANVYAAIGIGTLTAVGLDLTIDMVQAGSPYTLAVASFSEFLPPNSATPVPPDPYYNARFVSGKLPNNLAFSLTEPTQVYIRIYADFTASYQFINGVWVADGSDDSYLNDDAAPFPNLSTFWNGIGSLSFSTYRECESC
jgi:hypothetical protein